MSTNCNNLPSYGNGEENLSEDSEEYYLFLLEFFVKQASGNRLAKLNHMFFVPTSIHFGFLNFVDEDDLEVTPVDLLFEPQPGVINDTEIFNAGKSVLFATDHDAVTDRTVKMILNVTVRKRMPQGIKPDILVGTGELDLSGQYAALRLEMLQCWRKGMTISKVFDGQVPLIHDGDLIGNLDVFVRMSGFGQTIVTEFDAPMPQDSRTFVFSAEKIDQAMYKFHKLDPHVIDFFKDSSDDLQSPTCPICIPETYPCVPCGKIAAVEERDEKIKGRRDEAEKKLKQIMSKGLIQSSRGLAQSCGKPVVLKVSGFFDDGDGVDGKKPTVTVADESAAIKPGDHSSDPDHDVFVLRIGKKGLVGVGEKSDIQLEMKTPKGPERRPPIRYETREMQTDNEEESSKDKKKKRRK